MSDIDRHDDGGDDELDPEALFAGHKQSSEPLSESEMDAVIEAGLAARADFSMRGGQLWWHDATFPEPDDDALAVVQAGDPCPACGGRIVVDGACRHTRVPIYADGTTTDEGEGGDFVWDDAGPYCADCGERLRVEW